MQLDAEGRPLPPKIVVSQPSVAQVNDFPRDNRFMTAFIGELGPAICMGLCLLFFTLPYLIVPAIKGGTEFCNGYWKDQSNAQLGGMVIFFPLS